MAKVCNNFKCFFNCNGYCAFTFKDDANVKECN